MALEALPSPRTCPTCKGRRYVVEGQGLHASAKVCTCAVECRRCGGSGHVLVTQEETFSERVGPRQYEVLALCDCRLLRRRLAVFNEAALPAVLARAQLDSYRSFTEAQHRAHQAVTQFALAYRRNPAPKGFILSGPVGTGKTHLLVGALAHAILEAGAVARYVEISLLYAEIRRGFKEGKSGGEIIGPLSEVDLLAIDELGKGRGSPFELETLDELIARRYNAGRTTLFATNFALDYEHDEKGARVKGELRERVDERIYSRLCEMCEFLELPAQTPDLRRARQELDGRALPARGR